METYYQIGVLYCNFHYYDSLLMLSVFVSCGKEEHSSLNEIVLHKLIGPFSTKLNILYNPISTADHQSAPNTKIST